MKIIPSERIADLKPYFFAQLNNRISELRKKGSMSFAWIWDHRISPLKISLLKALWIQPGGAIPMAIPRWEVSLRSIKPSRIITSGGTGSSLDPQKETLALIGSKEGLFNLSQVFLIPGIVCLCQIPVILFTQAALKSPVQFLTRYLFFFKTDFYQYSRISPQISPEGRKCCG